MINLLRHINKSPKEGPLEVHDRGACLACFPGMTFLPAEQASRRVSTVLEAWMETVDAKHCPRGNTITPFRLIAI